MHIKRIKADGFKNLSGIEIFPHEKINVLYGKNAQGKTNLIEAMWLLSGVRSFRNTKDKDLIRLGGESFDLELDFFDGRRTQQIKAHADRQNIREKKITLNGVSQKGFSGLFGNLSCVVFTPEDLELSKGSPDIRRNFVDLSVSQIKIAFEKTVTRYEGVLHQRNALLKSIAYENMKEEILGVYDLELASMGAYITMLRYNYVKKLSGVASKLYERISGGKEALSLSYLSTVYDKLEGRVAKFDEISMEYLEALRKSRPNDIKSGFTQVGVQRDDIIAKINGLSARDFASQGQHRSIALVLKLAQAYILSQEKSNAPIILLDDILSELDKDRQKFVLSQIDNMQVFITCCEKIPQLKYGNIYEIENGIIK